MSHLRHHHHHPQKTKTDMKTLVAALTLLILTLSSCTETIVQEAPDVCGELGATEAQCRLMKQGRIALGMTHDMVRESWGEPNVGDDCPLEDSSNVKALIWSYRGPLSYNLYIDSNSCRVTKIAECENNWNHMCHDVGETAP